MTDLQHVWRFANGAAMLLLGTVATLWAFGAVSLNVPDTDQTRLIRRLSFFFGPFQIICGLWRLFS